MRAERTLYMRHCTGNPKTRGKGCSAGISAPFITPSFIFLYTRGKKEERGRYKKFYKETSLFCDTRLLAHLILYGRKACTIQSKASLRFPGRVICFVSHHMNFLMTVEDFNATNLIVCFITFFRDLLQATLG